jgi:hypothetical protein
MIALLALALLFWQAPARQTFFTSPYPVSEMTGKQAVVETDAGTIVIQLLPNAAPNHVGYFIKLAREGGYTGTIFHRVVRYGMIQGGDPLSRDPAKTAEYGTGGLMQLRAEISGEPLTAGAVAGVLVPGDGSWQHHPGAQTRARCGSRNRSPSFSRSWHRASSRAAS